jgi:hypothetical protein
LRTLMLTDLRWARAARDAAARSECVAPARAVIYSTTTAALLWPRPGAIHFDAPAAGNRPGRDGVWQRPLERRRFRAAPLLVAQSEGGLAEAPKRRASALVLPLPVEPSGPPAPARDVAAVTYAADPYKKGLASVLIAWAHARREPEELVVVGAPPLGSQARTRALGIRFTGLLPRAEFRALLRRARVYVTAPRREDYGLAQLEALADGCMLVTTPAPGPYAALAIARKLDPRLVGDELAGALRAALDDPRGDYRERARDALAPFGRAHVDALVRERLVPRLLAPGA